MISGFSFILCSYNGERFLQEALDSLLSTRYQKFEIIVVDDGSTDATRSLLKRYRRRSRIRIFFQENQGLGSARNTALQHCRYPWIATLDQDDISYPLRLGHYEHLISKKMDLVLIHSPADIIDDAGDIRSREFASWHYSPTVLSSEEAFSALVQKGCFPGSAYAAKKDRIMRIGGWDPAMTVACDYDLFFRLCGKGKFGSTPKAEYAWRTHANNTQMISPRRFEEYRQTLRKASANPLGNMRTKVCIGLKMARSFLGETKSRKKTGIQAFLNKVRKLKQRFILFLCSHKSLHSIYFLISIPKILLWATKACEGPVPPVIKRGLIGKILETSKAKRFVETGTHFGQTTAYVAAFGKVKVHTIELDKNNYVWAKENLSTRKNVNLLYGDSGELLCRKELLRQKTLYWLDGHFSGFGTAGSDSKSPIQKELREIMKHADQPIILIDDINDFLKENNEYPKLESIIKNFTLRKNFRLRIQNNILILTPKSKN